MRLISEAMLALLLAIPAALPPSAESDKAPDAAKVKGPRFPDFPAPPAPPPPKVDPAAVPLLSADLLYVVEDDTELIAIASPPALVTLTKESGPIRIRGRFIDGGGKVETRTYTGKSVVTVEAIADARGRVEVIVFPVGATKEEQVARRLVDVDGGRGPRPPPDPPTPPPNPPAPVPVTSFHVILVYESGPDKNYTAAQNSVLYGKAVGDYLNLKTTLDGGFAGWRRYDKDANTANETPVLKALWAAVKPQLTTVPCIVVAVNGKAEIIPLPATPVEAVAILKKYAEGK